MNKILLLVLVAISFGQIEYDPTQIKGADACENCHKSAVDHWKTTSHYNVFSGNEEQVAMHRRPESKEILKKMGMKSAKRGLCTNCHFTLQQQEGKKRAKAISGPSCESCHGTASNWIEFHGVFGNDANGTKATRETETAEHKLNRLKKADDAGMIRTHDIYNIVENCFECHTVPNEELVNVGGHKAGSDIDFQNWLNKEIKHNFLYSDGASNREAPRDFEIKTRNEKSKLIGLLVDLEYSLRGFAKSTEEGDYSNSMKNRIESVISKLNELKTADNDSKIISSALNSVNGVQIELTNASSLNTIADKVKSIAQNYSQN